MKGQFNRQAIRPGSSLHWQQKNAVGKQTSTNLRAQKWSESKINLTIASLIVAGIRFGRISGRSWTTRWGMKWRIVFAADMIFFWEIKINQVIEFSTTQLNLSIWKSNSMTRCDSMNWIKQMTWSMTSGHNNGHHIRNMVHNKHRKKESKDFNSEDLLQRMIVRWKSHLQVLSSCVERTI